MKSCWSHFRSNFHKNYGRQGPESEKWTPKVACRRRMALVMHIISLCVRSEGAHKQEMQILPCVFLVQDGPENTRSTKVPADRVTLGWVWCHLGVSLGSLWALSGYLKVTLIIRGLLLSHIGSFFKTLIFQCIVMILYNNWVIWGRLCDKFS